MDVIDLIRSAPRRKLKRAALSIIALAAEGAVDLLALILAVGALLYDQHFLRKQQALFVGELCWNPVQAVA